MKKIYLIKKLFILSIVMLVGTALSAQEWDSISFVNVSGDLPEFQDPPDLVLAADTVTVNTSDSTREIDLIYAYACYENQGDSANPLNLVYLSNMVLSQGNPGSVEFTVPDGVGDLEVRQVGEMAGFITDATVYINDEKVGKFDCIDTLKTDTDTIPMGDIIEGINKEGPTKVTIKCESFSMMTAVILQYVKWTDYGEPSGIAENSELDFNFYPNPVSSDYLYFTNHHNIQKIDVFNVIGSKVKSISNPGNNSLNLSDLNQGMYILVVQDNKNQRNSYKILKE